MKLAWWEIWIIANAVTAFLNYLFWEAVYKGKKDV